MGILKRHDHSRRSLKSSKEVRSLLKTSDVFRSLRTRINVSSLPDSVFHFKNQRSRERYCHLFILRMVFVPYMGLS